MQNVILIVHLLIAICLIAAVLLQRSEGGALGIGGGGGGLVSSRGTATALSKLTWALATGFIATSITLAILAGGDPAGRSVLDELQAPASGIILPDLPPAADDGAARATGLTVPVLPPAGDAPAAPAEAAVPAEAVAPAAAAPATPPAAD